jgi:hypothetical protein
MTGRRLTFLSASLSGIFAIAIFFPVTPAQAKQCSAERPSNARSYWSYRIIDGRKCWYEGKPMLSKSLLHWPNSRTAPPAPQRETNVTATRSTLFNAQASISGEATKPAPELRQETADANSPPAPERTLTRDHLRAWASGMTAMTAEPVVTILDRWPDQELPQQRSKPATNEDTPLITTRTMLMVIVMFMALVALLFHVTLHRRPFAEA